ncbi:MAG: biopolymer transporter ExbD [Bacteroidaceae bacterium]|nr:biopolymer transporter ExbD [Bacteroidaceae bacterium]
MGRFKIKKADLFIDMTPMSDVMLLLLTFFLMAGTFTKPEPVQVQAPGSVSDIKIPSTDILTIYVAGQGKDATATPDIFLTLDNAPIVNQLADGIKKLPLCNTIKKATIDEFRESQSIKVTIGEMVADRGAQDDATTDSQFKQIIKQARTIYNDINKKAKEKNPDATERNLRIAIKSDKNTPYSTIKLVMNSLQDIQENRYNLLTELKARPTE